MLKVIPNGKNQLNIESSGSLNTEKMKVRVDDPISKSGGIENRKMLYDLINVHLPTLVAIGVEFSRLPALFKVMKKFDRVAVLTDTYWLKKASEFEGALYPELEIKAFDRDQKKIAQAWLIS
jgi:hypothetical protein